MKLMASGVTNSAARVRSPSFSRSSSSTTTTMRPARISAKAPGTSVKGGSKVRGELGMEFICIVAQILPGSKNAARRRRFFQHERGGGLQRRFDFESPGFQESLRDVLRILVPASPLPKTGGPDVLVRAQLELLHNLFERGHSRYNGADGLRLAPVRISTTLCHWIGC